MTQPAVAPYNDPKRKMLRHTVATIAYRGGKAIRNAPAGFADFRGGEGVRTPVQILAHIGDLFDWALSIVEGQQKWNDAKPQPWEQESERFFATLKKFDNFLASDRATDAPMEKLFQGPVADALAHVGQIAILRRMAGGPIKTENYHKAAVEVGRVGSDQVPPKREW